MSEPLLNTAEAAGRLRLARITLDRWRTAGKGPAFVKMGRKVFYRPIDLDRWIEGQRQEPTKIDRGETDHA